MRSETRHSTRLPSHFCLKLPANARVYTYCFSRETNQGVAHIASKPMGMSPPCMRL